MHKGVFPVQTIEIIGVIVLSIMMMLSIVGGVGGGGVVVPLLMAFFKFNTKQAIALSGLSIVLCSITRFVYNFRQMHPYKETVSIDYGLAIVMLPTVLMGSFFGVIINVIFPPLILLVILALVLIFIAFRSAIKAKEIYLNENKERQEQEQAQAEDQEKKPENSEIDIVFEQEKEDQTIQQLERNQESILQNEPEKNIVSLNMEELKISRKDQEILTNIKISTSEVTNHCSKSNLDAIQSNQNEPTQAEVEFVNKLIQREKTHFQWDKHGICFSVLIVNLLVTLLRGSKSYISIIGIQTCSPLSWFFFSFFIVFCSVITVLSIKIVNKEQRLKEKVGKVLIDSDLRFKGKTIVTLVVFSTLGGWVSGALGLGGGAIFNPLLLSMGVPPTVASSTGMYLILFSTTSSSVAYIIFQTLNIPYGFWIGFWCSLSSIIGLYILNKVVKKFNRQSIIVFVFTFVMTISAILVPIFGALDLSQQAKSGQSLFSLTSIC